LDHRAKGVAADENCPAQMMVPRVLTMSGVRNRQRNQSVDALSYFLGKKNRWQTS
jgi:hypothetical protein